MFIPHVIVARLTFGLMVDAGQAVYPNEPRYRLAATCHILVRSRSLSIKYLADGNLEGYDLDLTPRCFFVHSFLTSQSVLDEWLNKHRQSLESLLGRAMEYFNSGRSGWETNGNEALEMFSKSV